MGHRVLHCFLVEIVVEVEQDTRRRKSLGFAVVIAVAAVAAAGMVHLEMERVAEIYRHLD